MSGRGGDPVRSSRKSCHQGEAGPRLTVPHQGGTTFMSAFAPFGHRAARSGRQDRAAPRLEELEDRTVPTLVGHQVFPADNPWNQKITGAPVAANSAAVINNLVTRYGDGRLH